MTIRRFQATNHKEAMRKVRDTLGNDAIIVLSRKAAQGTEIFAVGEAELDKLHTDDVPKVAVTDFPGLAEQLLSNVQDMRDMLHRQQGDKSPLDNRKRLYRQMMAGGYSHQLSRQLVAMLPVQLNHSNKTYPEALKWLQQQIVTRVSHQSGVGVDDWELLQHQGVIALVGPTGVGKTTSTAKLAANYVMQHGNDSLLLVTTDSYRIGAQQQLAIYAELLDVEMHALSDGDTLESLAEKMKGKRLVLVDTVGMSQRDQRLAQKIAALNGAKTEAATRTVLLLNAAAQQGTLDEVARIYQRIASECGLKINDCIITKVDETTRLGGVIDTVVRYHIAIQAVSSGQNVPEDMHIPDIEELVADSLSADVQDMTDLDDVELSNHAFNSLQVFTHGHLIHSCIQALRSDIPHFTQILAAWRDKALPNSWKNAAFPDELSMIRWAAPRPLQGWSHLTPHLGLTKQGLPLIPPVLHTADTPVLPDMALAPTQLFDYLPQTELLDIYSEHRTGWFAALSMNHKVQSKGRAIAVHDLIKKEGIPLSRHIILYRGERRRLELSLASCESEHSEEAYQVVYSELKGGPQKNPIQRRYWLTDGQCTAEQLLDRARTSLQLDEYARLTRIAWRGLDADKLDSTTHLALSGALAAVAMHVEYHNSARFARLRGDLLSSSGKRGRVQGDKLVLAIIHVIEAYQSLAAAGRAIEVQE